MKRLRLFFLELVSSIMSGVLGGLAAGLIFGLAVTIFSYLQSGNLPGTLIEIIYPNLYFFTIAGLIGGLVLGTIVGLTLPISRPYLGRISQILGGLAVVIPTLLLITSNMPPYVAGILLSLAIIAGIMGGTLAFKFYTKIYE